MTHDEVKAAQRTLNAYTKKYVRGVQPLIVDGISGPAFRGRVRWCKYWAGYGKTVNANSVEFTPKLVRSLRHPHSYKYNTLAVLRTGAARRTRQRVRYRQQHVVAALRSGVTTFDGVPCAKAAVPYLAWARQHGWRGRLNSGYRTPAYSESLCLRMCGRPQCPGRCAGRATNHAYAIPKRFAIDVSDYGTFGSLMARCPITPHIVNHLGAQDPVHYSPSGN